MFGNASTRRRVGTILLVTATAVLTAVWITSIFAKFSVEYHDEPKLPSYAFGASRGRIAFHRQRGYELLDYRSGLYTELTVPTSFSEVFGEAYFDHFSTHSSAPDQPIEEFTQIEIPLPPLIATCLAALLIVRRRCQFSMRECLLALVLTSLMLAWYSNLQPK